MAALIDWTFLTNHAHVLLCLAGDRRLRLRDVAARVGITERAVQRIVSELEAAGILTREREGRRNRYFIDPTVPLRHPIEAHCSVRDLLRFVLDEAQIDAASAERAAIATAGESPAQHGTPDREP